MMKKSLSIPELEKRMRPGAFSGVGFLGVTESLEIVLNQDRQTLEKLGVSSQRIANALGRILQTVEYQRGELSRKNYAEFCSREHCGYEWDDSREKLVFATDPLPLTDIGYVVDNTFQVFIWQSKGLQECPWGCAYE